MSHFVAKLSMLIKRDAWEFDWPTGAFAKNL